MSNPIQMLNEIKQNPVGFLMQRRLNIPANIANDPNKILQHLMNTGQVSQDQYNSAVRQAQQLGIRV